MKNRLRGMLTKTQKIGAVTILVFTLVAAAVFLSKKQPSQVTTQVFAEGLTEASVSQVIDYVNQSGAKVILLNVWASWCAPCIEEIPTLLQMQEDYRSLGFELVFFSADNKSDEDEVRQFLLENKLQRSFFRGKNSQQEIEQLYPNWSGALPVSVLYDQSRQVSRRWMGTVSEAEFREEIELALGIEEDQE